MVIKLNSAEEHTLGWSLCWEGAVSALMCELNLRADGQGPSPVVQPARAPDLVVHGLRAQVSTLTHEQAVLDFLLGAIVVREGPTTEEKGLEVRGVPSPSPTPVPRHGLCHAHLAKVSPMPLSANLPREERCFTRDLRLLWFSMSNYNKQTSGGQQGLITVQFSGRTGFFQTCSLPSFRWSLLAHLAEYMDHMKQQTYTWLLQLGLRWWLLAVVYLPDKTLSLCLMITRFSLVDKKIMLISHSNQLSLFNGALPYTLCFPVFMFHKLHP